MPPIPDDTPVLVGAGQFVERIDAPGYQAFPSPIFPHGRQWRRWPIPGRVQPWRSG